MCYAPLGQRQLGIDPASGVGGNTPQPPLHDPKIDKMSLENGWMEKGRHTYSDEHVMIFRSEVT